MSLHEENHRRGHAGHHVPVVLHGHLLLGALRTSQPGGRSPASGVPQILAHAPSATLTLGGSMDGLVNGWMGR